MAVGAGLKLVEQLVPFQDTFQFESFIDAWASEARADEVPRLFSVPLKYSTSDKAAELDISLALDKDDMSQGALRIHWGEHQLETAFEINVTSPTFYRESSQ